MISKELLSEVLKIEHILEYRISVNTIWVTDAKSHVGAMALNIYELAHKCKEWAFKKGYILSSFRSCCYINSLTMTFIDEFNGNSEIEAIIKACEWILKEGN